MTTVLPPPSFVKTLPPKTGMELSVQFMRGGEHESRRAIRAYETTPYIRTVVDMMDEPVFQTFLETQARQNWESLGVYVRLYSDLCAFYKTNPVAIRNLYQKTGGLCSGSTSKKPTKQLLSWMMKIAMTNANFRKKWFEKDRRCGTKTKRKNNNKLSVPTNPLLKE